MGNNQSRAIRVQLKQAQLQIQALQAQNKAARLKVAKVQKEALVQERAQPEQFVVNSARFSQVGSSVDQPSPVKLTLTNTDGILSKPLQLLEEASKRGLTLTEEHQTRTLPDGTQTTYHFYHGLTDPNSQVPQRPGYGVQRHTFNTNLVFVIRIDGEHDQGLPQCMTEDDVKWAWSYLKDHRQNPGAIGLDLRERMAQQMGRPGVPMPFVESAASTDAYSLSVHLPPRDRPSETIQFRPPSAFSADQIHFQQVDSR